MFLLLRSGGTRVKSKVGLRMMLCYGSDVGGGGHPSIRPLN